MGFLNLCTLWKLRLVIFFGNVLEQVATVRPDRARQTVVSSSRFARDSDKEGRKNSIVDKTGQRGNCLLYTSDAADDTPCVDL
eukprot:1854938-Amphidinium_carterae.1